jgi:hypothetical protein
MLDRAYARKTDSRARRKERGSMGEILSLLFAAWLWDGIQQALQ